MKKITKIEEKKHRIVFVELDDTDILELIEYCIIGEKNYSLINLLNLKNRECVTTIAPCISVPGGGDHSNMLLDIDKDCPLRLKITITLT